MLGTCDDDYLLLQDVEEGMILSIRTTATKLVAFLVATTVLGYDDQQQPQQQQQQGAPTLDAPGDGTVLLPPILRDVQSNHDKILPSIILPRRSTRRGSVTNFTSWVTTTSNGPSSSQSTKAYLVVTNEEWSVEIPPSSELGDGTSTWTANRRKQTTQNHRPFRTTAHQAKRNHCDVVATNGGPFNLDGTSSGPLVYQGQLQTNHTESSYVGMGMTVPQLTSHFSHDLEPKPHYWVMGTYSQVMEQFQEQQQQQQPEHSQKLKMNVPSIVWEFVTGFDWLVHNGTAVADNSNNPTGAHQAARTVMGLNRELNFFLLVTDGCERW
jgi:hypothetical protein